MRQYKIPKSLNGLLEEVGFNSNAGVMSFKDTADGEPATYIAFDDFTCITTLVQRN